MALKMSKNLSKVKEDLSPEAILKRQLAGFLSENELEVTEIKVVEGRVSFSAPDSILQKIEQNMPVGGI